MNKLANKIAHVAELSIIRRYAAAAHKNARAKLNNAKKRLDRAIAREAARQERERYYANLKDDSRLDPEVRVARRNAVIAYRRFKGRASILITGGYGRPGPANLQLKTLLGQ